MREPREELKATADEQPPDFDALTPPDELVRGERTRDDFLDAALQLSEAATVDEVADIADHGPDAAREYLEWFERMGIVEQIGRNPVTYRRNREYLVWRRAERIRNRYEPDEIAEMLATEAGRADEFETAFGVADPDHVRVHSYASETDQSIEDVWEQLAEWHTTRRRIELLERALSTDDSLSGHHRPVA
ncbi:hypothetical protein GS429_07125 [Natronorubrum sp. JWXQ-INN-674]|uniref:Sugar-specific transcriptional regulator TrmB n=1 Tax=Natronorubrum halalkaliphilum TaxID=2691917 RepID=A0A6B0VJ11_9EURY|nr:hypothetical protein [Natronorubrum halalkaliphilum]MXV61841.1 hypothetical protein [Natronorubrum halalkaliphilum]